MTSLRKERQGTRDVRWQDLSQEAFQAFPAGPPASINLVSSIHQPTDLRVHEKTRRQKQENENKRQLKKKRRQAKDNGVPLPVFTLAKACFTSLCDSWIQLCTQQTNDSTLERIEIKVGLETRKTLDYTHKTSSGTAPHNPRRVCFALFNVELNCLATLRRAFSLASEIVLTAGCSCPTMLTTSFLAAFLSTDPTQ